MVILTDVLVRVQMSPLDSDEGGASREGRGPHVLSDALPLVTFFGLITMVMEEVVPGRLQMGNNPFDAPRTVSNHVVGR